MGWGQEPIACTSGARSAAILLSPRSRRGKRGTQRTQLFDGPATQCIFPACLADRASLPDASSTTGGGSRAGRMRGRSCLAGRCPSCLNGGGWSTGRNPRRTSNPSGTRSAAARHSAPASGRSAPPGDSAWSGRCARVAGRGSGRLYNVTERRQSVVRRVKKSCVPEVKSS